MILCTKNQLAAARRAHPAKPLLCEEEARVYLPGGNAVPMSAERVRAAMASQRSVRFVSDEAGVAPVARDEEPSDAEPDGG